MRGHFFCLQWNPKRQSEADAAEQVLSLLSIRCPHLVVAFRSNGLTVLIERPEAQSRQIRFLPDRAGVILGTLFERRSDPFDPSPYTRALIDQRASSSIRSAGADHLVAHYWGDYLALVTDRQCGTVWIVRSPTCHTPCLFASVHGLRAYFSATRDLARLGVMALSVNWNYVAVYTACGRVHCSETGLNEVRELQNGEYHRISEDGITSAFCWNPVDICRSDVIEDAPRAQAALRATTLACVTSWASNHDRIVHRLSGGIDSSVIAACLRGIRKPQVTCVNYYSRGAYGDEREFARLAARKFDFELIEYRQNSTFRLDSLLEYPPTDSPLHYLFKIECDAREVALARHINATARFTGTMGDILFQMPPFGPAVTELIQRLGLHWSLFKAALEAAQCDRISLWRILKNAFADAIFRSNRSGRPGEFKAQDVMLLTAEASTVFDNPPLRFVHPWLHSIEHVPAGKLAQVSCLGFNSTYFNALHEPDESELIHPLISEPLVELCLRIPTYLLLHDGRDRAMVRNAFAAELPVQIFNRASKGSMSLWVREMVSANAEFVRELLLEGVLVREHIIDRRKLEASLPGRAARSPLPIGCFLDCVAAEAWSRVWLERGHQRAAA
jgi:asparagine synthase (glutamine-hydrolysing)